MLLLATGQDVPIRTLASPSARVRPASRWINHEAPAPIDEEAQLAAAGLARETAEAITQIWARDRSPAPVGVHRKIPAISVNCRLTIRGQRSALLVVLGRDRMGTQLWFRTGEKPSLDPASSGGFFHWARSRRASAKLKSGPKRGSPTEAAFIIAGRRGGLVRE